VDALIDVESQRLDLVDDRAEVDVELAENLLLFYQLTLNSLFIVWLLKLLNDHGCFSCCEVAQIVWHLERQNDDYDAVVFGHFAKSSFEHILDTLG